MYGALDISTSGMIVQRTRMNVISANIANSSAIMNDKGEAAPFRRRIAMLAQGQPNNPDAPGVHIASIEQDQSPFRKVYDPNHPLAAKVTDPSRDLIEGYVNYPNIDTTTEMIGAIEATRAYEANIMAAEATKSMMAQSLRLIA